MRVLIKKNLNNSVNLITDFAARLASIDKELF